MEEMRFCQSCGMPLQTADVFGTNEDGGKNEEYCIFCYKNGSFTSDVSMEEMIAISLSHMEELFKDNHEYNEIEALRKMQRFFPELKRWKK